MRTLFLCSLSFTLTACLEIDVKETTPTTPTTTTQPTTQPTTPTATTNTNPPTTANNDDDGDGLTNAMEAQLGTDPNNADTDGGGIDDGDEVIGGTDPLNPSDDIDDVTATGDTAITTPGGGSGGSGLTTNPGGGSGGWTTPGGGSGGGWTTPGGGSGGGWTTPGGTGLPWGGSGNGGSGGPVTTPGGSGGPGGTGTVTTPPTGIPVAPATGWLENFVLFEADSTSPGYADSLLALTPFYGARLQLSWTNANDATLEVAIGRSGYDWDHDNIGSTVIYTCDEEQILCRSEMELQGTFSNPFVSFGPQTITQGGYTAHDVVFTGRIDGPGDNLKDLHVSALLPTIDYIGETCENSLLISGVGGLCVPCPGSATDDCLMIEATVADPVLMASDPGCMTPTDTFSNLPSDPHPVCPN